VRGISDAGDDGVVWAREVCCEERFADSSVRTGDQDVGSLCHFGR